MAGALDLQFADLKAAQNNKNHFTNAISTKQLIARRGQTVHMSLHFKKRGYQPDLDKLVFIAETGPQPSEASRTMAMFPLSTHTGANRWGATVKENSIRSLEILLTTPANAIIGYYSLSLQIFSEEKQATHHLGKLVLLFNPWCQDDTVFMQNEAKRKEYVLNETGIIFNGHAKFIQARTWIFGQFEQGILDICLQILDQSLFYLKDPMQDVSLRNDPTYVGRVVSSMINSNDDNGVVEGNWSGDYKDGRSPSDWNGSVAILREWATSRFKPVKYGQCWVFAGVMCTVMRCLGIPTRVVTNFESAHDTHSDLNVDILYDEHGKQLEKETHDSVWNFHVWNECWMQRFDLPAGFGGWQVLDATPQETSNGIFCLGPASVKAIKEGDVNLSFDGRFVFAEVNAIVISWLLHSKTLKKEKLHGESHSVGQHISTKAVGVNARDDITSEYKHEDGSIKERQILLKANPQGVSSLSATLPLNEAPVHLPAISKPPISQ
ncbi:protein-glutamine gamma-glutamyltransferase 5-like [Ambystoma mexicanum]|uniref:protein-glutamine gamma-glutamyltransferase 5-like n=1 Tax=Ambystoma mexicanum TaxID=8296 RepID=UPI0037E90CF2